MTTPKKTEQPKGGAATAIQDPPADGPTAQNGQQDPVGTSTVTAGQSSVTAPTQAQAPVAQATAPPAAKPPAKQEGPTPEQIAAAVAVLNQAGIKTADQVAAEDDAADQALAGEEYETPQDYLTKAGVAILMDACDIYGIDPNPKAIPRELLDWKHYPENRQDGIQEHVVLITAGGTKLKHFEDGIVNEDRDRDTVMAIRRVLHLFTMDPITRQTVPLPLPADLTLSAEAVTGQVIGQDHVYQGGYLASGGKLEAARREEVRASRSAKGHTGPYQPMRRRRGKS